MKIFFDTVGCRLNQSEIEKYATQFSAAGHEMVENPACADLVVINTCAVTAKAGSDSRQKIRQAQKAGKARIVVTGCWSELEPGKAASMDHVERVIPNAIKDNWVSDYLGIPRDLFDQEPLVRKPLPGVHKRTRAFLKAQDGCDNSCTFCVTRLVRGKGRSIPASDVIHDVIVAVNSGVKEVVLSGVNLGSWGRDLDTKMQLRDLVEKILAQTTVSRLRFSSLEPWDIDKGFFDLWQDERVCRHLHLPLQSGCEETLRRMGRKITTAKYSTLVEQARCAIENLAVTTDIMVGFPGENQEEFSESLAFVRRMEFSNGHVFTYSCRPGTPAARLKVQVNGNLLKQWGEEMRSTLAESANHFEGRFIGSQGFVLWESADQKGPQGWRLHGLTDNYLHVCAVSEEKLWNQISRVQIERQTEKWLEGTIIG
jgi:threonylcarbamoyladenosine tRNA methylthiotransferase MtaB